MSNQSLLAAIRNSNEMRRTKVPRKIPRAQSFPRHFGVVAKALWPNKTAMHLADRVGVSERAAKHWISNRREPSPIAVAIVVDLMLGRSE